jgi:hypothetical protein
VLLLTRFPQIGQRIRDHLSDDDSYSAKMRKSYDDFMNGKTTTFVEFIEEFLRARPTRSAADTEEKVLETIIQLVWYEQMQSVSQLHLVGDPTKAWGAGRNKFVDFLIGNSRRQLSASNSILVMELKNVKLLYLWKARQRDRNAEPKSQNAYEPLLSELMKVTEDQLLDMEYTYFDKTNHQLVTKQVKGTLQAATVQLSEYIRVVSNGKGGSARHGVDDDRILCTEGEDVLQGYVVMCVGGKRVVCRQTATRETQYSYKVVPAGSLHIS